MASSGGRRSRDRPGRALERGRLGPPLRRRGGGGARRRSGGRGGLHPARRRRRPLHPRRRPDRADVDPGSLRPHAERARVARRRRDGGPPPRRLRRAARRLGYAGFVTRSVIVSAVRTPFGKLGGSLARKPATELGSIVIKAALERAGLQPDEVEYVIMGQVLQAGAGQAPPPPAAIGARLPLQVGAGPVTKVCASPIR